jgi:hypothetical protein
MAAASFTGQAANWAVLRQRLQAHVQRMVAAVA